MKGEQVFRAVGQIGDDLIARAEKIPARQTVRWKPLAALAACCALIVGIAALALPRWIGNKAANTTAAAREAAPQAAMAEDAAEARAYSEDVLVESAAPETEFEEYAPAEEAPAMDAPTADAPAAGASEQSARAQAEAGAPDGDWIVFGGQYYTLAAANDEAHTAGESDGEARGAQLGAVDDSKDGTLAGCAVYAYPAEGCVLVERDGEYLLYRAVE